MEGLLWFPELFGELYEALFLSIAEACHWVVGHGCEKLERAHAVIEACVRLRPEKL
jgi:hypothetical protein